MTAWRFIGQFCFPQVLTDNGQEKKRVGSPCKVEKCDYFYATTINSNKFWNLCAIKFLIVDYYSKIETANAGR